MARNPGSGCKRKVKSGCRTCKVRKIKCDEGWPVCRRCVSTGRTCEGYGIWGGGGVSTNGRPAPVASLVLSLPKNLAYTPSLSPDERLYWEWFTERTAAKFSVRLLGSFWGELVLQASLAEPAVLHAVLALGCVHQRGCLRSSQQRSQNWGDPDLDEAFVLRNYIRATSLLRTRLVSRTRESCSVILVACAVFVSLEMLRGHFEAAQRHLHFGLKVLDEARGLPSRGGHSVVDTHIVGALTRFSIQLRLFNPAYRPPYARLHQADRDLLPSVFQSFAEAWSTQEILLDRICDFSKLRGEIAGDTIDICVQSLIREHTHQQLVSDLAQYLQICEASRVRLLQPGTIETASNYRLLLAYHHMAGIMVDAAGNQSPQDSESVYDAMTDRFLTLLDLLAGLQMTIESDRATTPVHGHSLDMLHSVVDMAWIPPLYYIATKCRVHRIRSQAIRLLGSSSHREGIWDAAVAVCVARKVMAVEERDFYDAVDLAEDFPLTSVPSAEDLCLPMPPASYRLRAVEVALVGDPTSKLLLFTRLRNGRRVPVSAYSIASQRWTDEVECLESPEAPNILADAEQTWR